MSSVEGEVAVGRTVVAYRALNLSLLLCSFYPVLVDVAPIIIVISLWLMVWIYVCCLSPSLLLNSNCENLNRGVCVHPRTDTLNIAAVPILAICIYIIYIIYKNMYFVYVVQSMLFHFNNSLKNVFYSWLSLKLSSRWVWTRRPGRPLSYFSDLQAVGRFKCLLYKQGLFQRVFCAEWTLFQILKCLVLLSVCIFIQTRLIII